MTQTNTSNKGTLGILSLTSIIVGTVIGSGIYVKNNFLMETTSSAILVFVGWIIGGLLVLAILISFFEINSITTENKSAGTLSNYALFLFSPRASRIIAIYYFLFYFPFLISSKSIFAASQIYSLNVLDIGLYFNWLILTLTALIPTILIASLLIFTLRGTKFAITTGAIIKTMPLFFIIIMMFLVLFGLSFGDVTQLNHIFDANNSINSGLSDENAVLNLFLILPAIMFTFDGFLYSHSLSDEAKSQSTLKLASIIAIFIVTFVYLLFSLSIVLLSPNGKYGVLDVIGSMFPRADWLLDITVFVIIISIISSAIGSTMANNYSATSASMNNQISDPNGILVRRGKSTLPYNTMIIFLAPLLFWFVIMRTFDLIAISILTDVSPFYIGMTDYMTNILATMNFFIYGILIFGAILNRKSKKQDVDKEKLFYPASFFAIILISIITFTNIYDIFYKIIFSNDPYEALLHLTFIILFFSLGIIIIWLNEIWHKTNSYKVSERKQILINSFENHIPYSDIDYDYEKEVMKNNRKNL